MDVNLRLENPSVDRQGRRSTFHLIHPKIAWCLSLYLAYWRQNAIEWKWPRESPVQCVQTMNVSHSTHSVMSPVLVCVVLYCGLIKQQLCPLGPGSTRKNHHYQTLWAYWDILFGHLVNEIIFLLLSPNNIRLVISFYSRLSFWLVRGWTSFYLRTTSRCVPEQLYVVIYVVWLGLSVTLGCLRFPWKRTISKFIDAKIDW
jgi:hypothetical protein